MSLSISRGVRCMKSPLARPRVVPEDRWKEIETLTNRAAHVFERNAGDPNQTAGLSTDRRCHLQQIRGASLGRGRRLREELTGRLVHSRADEDDRRDRIEATEPIDERTVGRREPQRVV